MNATTRNLQTLIDEAGDLRTADKNLPIATLWQLLDAAIKMTFLGNSVDDGEPVRGAASPYASQRGTVYGGGYEARKQIIADLGLDERIMDDYFRHTDGYSYGDGLADYFYGDGSPIHCPDHDAKLIDGKCIECHAAKIVDVLHQELGDDELFDGAYCTGDGKVGVGVVDIDDADARVLVTIHRRPLHVVGDWFVAVDDDRIDNSAELSPVELGRLARLMAKTEDALSAAGF